MAKKQAASPTVAMSAARDRRPHHPGHVERARAQRDRVHQVLALHDLGDERLPGRHLEGGEQAEEDREPHDPVHRHQVERTSGCRAASASISIPAWRISTSRCLLTRSAMTPPYSVKSRIGSEPSVVTSPTANARIGQVQHQPPLGHRLDPGAAQRDELADEEQPEVAVPEGGEDGAEVGRSGRHGGKVSEVAVAVMRAGIGGHEGGYPGP